LRLGPIEQNVQGTGNKGVYELTFIEQATRPLERFATEAAKYGAITDGKEASAIERLVSQLNGHWSDSLIFRYLQEFLLIRTFHVFSSGSHFRTVPQSMAQMLAVAFSTKTSPGIFRSSRPS
jgi:hypothetical protein